MKDEGGRMKKIGSADLSSFIIFFVRLAKA